MPLPETRLGVIKMESILRMINTSPFFQLSSLSQRIPDMKDTIVANVSSAHGQLHSGFSLL